MRQLNGCSTPAPDLVRPSSGFNNSLKRRRRRSYFIGYLRVNWRGYGGKCSYEISGGIARNSLMSQYPHKLDIN